jgi:serine/threonine protein kinase
VALFKRLPFIPNNLTNYLELFDMIGKAEYKICNYRINLKGRELSKELEDILLKMMDKNPKRRIKASEIKDHPFISAQIN